MGFRNWKGEDLLLNILCVSTLIMMFFMVGDLLVDGTFLWRLIFMIIFYGEYVLVIIILVIIKNKRRREKNAQ